MIKAYVLVVTNPGETKNVVAAIGKVSGVKELHEVMGPYDIVIEIEGGPHSHGSSRITHQMSRPSRRLVH